jgi:cadmium resistance protein CadD (predicted permease)
MTGIFNIVVGLVMIVGGLSGKLALLGTNSGTLLAAVGLIPLVMGIRQFWRAWARRRNLE